MKKVAPAEELITPDAIPAMVWASDIDGRQIYFNRAWLQFVGRTLPQELGDGWASGIHPDDRAACLEAQRSSLAARQPFKVNYRLRSANGDYRWVLSQAEPRFDKDKVFQGFIGSAIDITDYKSSEEVSAKLAAIVQSSDDAIITKDLNGIISSWNNSAQRIFGYTEAEVVGRPITILIPPELQNEEKDILSRLRSGRRIDHFETVRIAKGGKRVLISLTVSPVKDASGKIVAASKVARDVTRTREIEEALREAEQRMRFCLEAAHVGTWHWDMKTGSVRWSENMEKIHGMQPGSFQGNFDAGLDVVISEDRDAVRQAIQRALEGDGKYHAEYRQKRSDGSTGWMEAQGQIIYDALNRPLSMMGVCRDISQRKFSEAALRQAREQLETRVRERTGELDRAQERLRMLSARLMRMQDEERRKIARELHDTAGQLLVALNLILVPVEAELKKKDAALSGQVSESLRLIDELSSDLRTMSHLLHPPLLDEAGLHSAVRWYIEGFAERSKIDVQLHLDENVGRLPRQFETAIFRVVQECLTNIHRHSESKSANILITRDSDHLKLEIQDHGKGMATPAPRAGVGLQGMRERVHELGGHLDIESGKGGTRVTAMFPMQAATRESLAESLHLAS